MLELDTNEDRLIPPTMLYRFAMPCKKYEGKWSAKTGSKLSDEFILPPMAVLDGRRTFADVRAGWSTDGLYFEVDIANKQQSVWCRETQLVESDGLQVWIDTRDTHNVHRATRFCHWFLFLPTGGGSKRDQPIATMLRINRAKDDPKSINQVKPKLIAKEKLGGYQMKVHIPSRALSGWNPVEHPNIGFNYAIVDRELGWQTLAVGPEFPISEDPSLWQTLQLKDTTS